MRRTLPGLFDLQVNGFGGVDFNQADLTADRVLEALTRMRTTGVTRCLPTLITSSFDRFAASARVLAGLSDAAIVGLHMEGPYLSPEDGARGAHSREHVIAASIDDFERRQEAAHGRIALVTLAPEVPGALPLVEHLVAAGVRVAIGHTMASPEQLRDATAAGATLATHLGNGCPQLLPRHPNVIWELLAADAVAASFIVDGHHLPAATVKAMIRAKGTKRSVLVSDAMAAAGWIASQGERGRSDAGGEIEVDTSEGRDPVGALGRHRGCEGERFTLGDVICELGADGRVSLSGTPYLAGSSLTLDRAIGHTVRFTGLALDDVIPMASTIPAALLGTCPAGTVTAEWDEANFHLQILDVTP